MGRIPQRKYESFSAMRIKKAREELQNSLKEYYIMGRIPQRKYELFSVRE